MGECAVAVVSVGASASLVFTEVDEALLNDEAQAGIHVCVYVDGFRRSYDACEQRGLVFNNPRFVYLDTCATYAEAVASRQFRFKDVIDVHTGKKILELEHETRSMRHIQCFKSLKYEPVV
mmetsp:Transcript_17864/g.34848  ORF Transcript_17864/g.34848 Transcript_17864/m.34848 type:complete len:121 (+) Transcript_17864:44-406(+)